MNPWWSAVHTLESHWFNDIPPCFWKRIVIYATVSPPPPPISPFLSAQFRCKSCPSNCHCKWQPNTPSSEWFLSQPAGGVLGQRWEHLRLVPSWWWEPCLVITIQWRQSEKNTFTNRLILDWVPVVPTGNVLVFDNIWVKISLWLFMLFDWLVLISTDILSHLFSPCFSLC